MADNEIVEKSNSDTQSDVWKALGLALMLPYGYLLAFAYASGVAAYWGIPGEFVSVSWEEALTAITAAFLTIGGLVNVSGLYFILPPRIRGLRNARLVGIWALFTWVLFGLSFHWIIVAASGVVTLLLVLVNFVLPVFLKDENTYVDRLRMIEASPTPPKLRDAWDMVADTLGLKAFTGLFLAALLAMFAWGLGYRNAKTRHEFWVSVADQQQVLIAKYADTLIFGRIRNGELAPHLIARTLSNSPADLVLKHFEHLAPIGGDYVPWHGWPFESVSVKSVPKAIKPSSLPSNRLLHLENLISVIISRRSGEREGP